MPVTANSHLADSLFRPPTPARTRPEPVRDMQQATRNARGRWPELAGMVDAAVKLVEENCLYEIVGEPTVLALCRLESTGRSHLVSLTATGLACTCDAWPPPGRAGPGDGLYCPDILGTLLQVYLRQPFCTLPFSSETLWQTTLADLQRQMTRATFDNWLAGSTAVPAASSPLLLTVSVRNRYAQEWLAGRLDGTIRRTLAAIAGYRVDIRFVIELCEGLETLPP